jgi:hypothetical protein
MSFGKNAKRMAAMKKLCAKTHWEIVRNPDRSMLYCMKEETRLEGPWEFGIKPVKRDSKADWD